MWLFVPAMMPGFNGPALPIQQTSRHSLRTWLEGLPTAGASPEPTTVRAGRHYTRHLKVSWAVLTAVSDTQFQGSLAYLASMDPGSGDTPLSLGQGWTVHRHMSGRWAILTCSKQECEFSFDRDLPKSLPWDPLPQTLFAVGWDRWWGPLFQNGGPYREIDTWYDAILSTCPHYEPGGIRWEKWLRRLFPLFGRSTGTVAC